MSVLRIRLESATSGPVSRPAIARLQSLVRGYLARRLVSKMRFRQALAYKHGFGVAAGLRVVSSDRGGVRVALTLGTRLALPCESGTRRAEQPASHAHHTKQRACAKPPDVVVVTTAIFVGIVALAVLRNPSQARASAQVAAAIVAALMLQLSRSSRVASSVHAHAKKCA